MPKLLWANLHCLLDTSSGASMTVRQMLHELRRSGWDIQILGATNFDNPIGAQPLNAPAQEIKDDPSPFVNVEDHGLVHHLFRTMDTYRLKMQAWEQDKWYARYRTMLQDFEPDVVFYYGGRPFDTLIASEAQHFGIPSVHYLANGNFVDTYWYRSIDTILTTGYSTAQMYKDRLGINVTPIGPFIRPYDVVASHHERTTALFVNPSPEKGAYLVAQLALFLEQQRPEIPFEVVESRGTWDRVVDDVTSYYEIPRTTLQNVRVTPHVQDMRGPYSRARVLLAPSLWWESYGRVGVESTLNAIPGLITNRGGLSEAFGDAAFKFALPSEYHRKPYNKALEPDAVTSIASALVRFFDDDDYYKEMCRRAETQGQRHRIENSTQRLESALLETINANVREVR